MAGKPWMTTVERFWSKVRVPLDPAGCWDWAGFKSKYGYGQMITGSVREGNRSSVSPHVFSYRLHYGLPPPDKPLVLHHCDVGYCANPAHLYAGDQKQNMLDMASRGRQWQQKRATCKNGHPWDETNTAWRGIGLQRRCIACLAARDARRKAAKALFGGKR